MNKVVIIGSPGSGKSSFAVKIARQTGLPLIHLDRLYWKPGWEKTPVEAWVPLVEKQTKGEAWIIDGNYQSTLELRIAAADTVIFLDMPRWICLCRVVKRRFANLGKTRPDMGPDCPEKLDQEFFLFLKFVWNFEKISGAPLRALMDRYREGRDMTVLKSPKEVRDYLLTLSTVKSGTSTSE